jgi:hypothetical protein
MVGTREPVPRTLLFLLVRGRTSCAWAVGRSVPADIAAEIDGIAASESPVRDFEEPPVNAARYLSLVEGIAQSGPAFAFPEVIDDVGEAVLIDDPGLIESGFPDLVDEMHDRTPFAAVLEDDRAVSVCFCARRSDEAAEAGLLTLESHRGRGYGATVTSTWAKAIRRSGRIPLYSTWWTNTASRSVAKKLGLTIYASDWGIQAEGY